MSKYVWHRRNDDELYYIHPDGHIIGSVIRNLYWECSVEGTEWKEKYFDQKLAMKAVEGRVESFKKNDNAGIILIGSIIVMAFFANWTALVRFFNDLFPF